VNWDNYHSRDFKENLRQDFYGQLLYNPVTDTQEIIFSSSLRLLKYVQSFIIATPFLLLAMCIMLCGLNALGYVDDDEIFNIRFISSLSRKGGLFEKGSLMGFIPSILLPVTMGWISKIYRAAAEVSTNWENHKTKQSHTNSVVLKRFLFDFIFFFSHLFYVAFEKWDMEGLWKELMILCIADEFRRIAVEVALPYFTQWKVQNVIKSKSLTIAQEEYEELLKPEYEYFEDYLELVI